jgi:tripartite-type tricarboxylate transporter receptor subunit TctC
MSHSIVATVVAAAAFALPAFGHAQAWPSRPIKIVVQFSPGGTTDIIARTMADRLAQELGQPVIVDNRPGASGSIGSDAVAKAAPDGYTIGMATVTTHSINPAVFKKLPYDVMRDLAPITRLVSVPNVLAVSAALPVKSMPELIAMAKAKPTGTVTYGSAGLGSEGNLMGELFNQSAGVKLLHIPYKGSAPAIQEAMGGQIDMVFDNLPSSLPFIQSGKLRALAVASPQRVSVLPDVPTFAEAGLAPVNSSSWFGLIAPAKTPKAVIDRIHAASVKVLAQPEVRTAIAKLGGEPVGNRPDEFTVQIVADLDKFKRLADSSGVRLD